MKSKFVLILGLILALGITVQAESLKEKKFYKEQMDLLGKEMEPINTACGTKITADFNKSCIAKWIDSGRSLYGYCSGGAGALATLCGDEDGKKEVSAKVKKVYCDCSGTDKADISLKGGTLNLKFGQETSHMHDPVKKYLENAL